jgi:redox-sensitive bicupin YhaK (pirin superfamily)
MSTPRPVRQSRAARPTLEGVGVHLHRAFGSTGEAVLFDPFLLLDDFRADDPKEFVVEGAGTFAAGAAPAERRTVLLMGDGDTLEVEASVEGCRFLAIAGKPLREPIAWAGPIVMNTQEELDQAFREYRDGTFLKGR